MTDHNKMIGLNWDNISHTRAFLEYARAHYPGTKQHEKVLLAHKRNVDKQKRNMDQAHLSGHK